MMNWLVLSAGVEGLKAAGGHMNRSGSLADNWFWIVAVLVIVVFWVGLYYWDKKRKQIVHHEGTDAKSLFLELCKAHKLNKQDRALLTGAAKAKELENPAILFVDNSLLNGLAGSGGGDAANYAALGRKLFGRGYGDTE